MDKKRSRKGNWKNKKVEEAHFSNMANIVEYCEVNILKVLKGSGYDQKNQ